VGGGKQRKGRHQGNRGRDPIVHIVHTYIHALKKEGGKAEFAGGRDFFQASGLTHYCA
jgi:hypothetical protein